jgi:hypothetical protein
MLVVIAAGALPNVCHGVLYVYEPFNYTVGQNLGGVDADPDPLGPPGTPVGQVGSYTADFGSGTSYTWYARGTASNYQSTKDAVVSSGNLSYSGLAASQGNSVSYGSALPNTGVASDPADTFNRSLFSDTIALPVEVTSGSLYMSFITRIKSHIEDGTSVGDRVSPASMIPDLTNAGNAGAALSGGAGGSVAAYGGGFWIRRDPANLAISNFGAGKASGDGIGNGNGTSDGPTTSWQISDETFNGNQQWESNQFGDLDGQPAVNPADSNTWTTYFVVVKYEFDALVPAVNGQSDAVSIWVNPGSGTLGTPGGEALASQAASGNIGSYFGSLKSIGSATGDVTSLNSFALIGHRQNTNNTIAVDFDELRIGTTWADVTPTATNTPGDHNGDGSVNAADYVVWRKNPIGFGGDAGYTAWRSNFGNPPGSGSAVVGGSVPEPATGGLLLLSAIVCGAVRRR